MLHAAIIIIAWPGAASALPLSGAFWMHQAVSVVASLLFLRGVASLADRRPPDPVAKVIPFLRQRRR